jgi:formylglycine-generating enzyme required for sulfatase activity
MVVLPGPVEFLMGSPATEKGRYDSEERQHRKRIGRSFALAAQLVTWEQYLEFEPQAKDERQDRYSPTVDCPANYIAWSTAVAYCNWLSEKEGIAPDQWCYEIRRGKLRLKKKYLSLTGYRLPTEAETEYSTRAGALTSRYFGETDELLPRYAWYQENSKVKTWPVGSLKPNDLGFFDLQGNLNKWCQESYQSYPQIKISEISEDNEEADLVVIGTVSRVVRGGSFADQASDVRSANRYNLGPAQRAVNYGFRPARTFR